MAKTYYTAKKQKKPNKIWANIKFFLASLISNDYCVEARKKPWYAAVIIALVSIVVALIPVMTSTFSAKGSDIMAAPTYGYETSLADFSQSLQANNVYLKVEDGKLVDVQDSWNTAYGEAGTVAAYLHEYETTTSYYPSKEGVDENGSSTIIVEDTPIYETKTVVDLAVYYYPENPQQSLGDYARLILESTDPAGNKDYSINAIFLGTNEFLVYKHPQGANQAAGSRAYTWNVSSFEGKTLVEILTTKADGTRIVYDEKQPIEYRTQIMDNFKRMLDEGYASAAYIGAWSTTGIIFGVFVLLTFILGLVIFLMTRGKNNPFRIYTFWETQKIAYWASFTPAVISMILAFLVPSFALMGFLFIFGIRVVWMSMKSLRPYAPNA